MTFARRAALCSGCLAKIPCARSRGARLREFAPITFAMLGGRTVAASGPRWAGSGKGGGEGAGWAVREKRGWRRGAASQAGAGERRPGVPGRVAQVVASGSHALKLRRSGICLDRRDVGVDSQNLGLDSPGICFDSRVLGLDSPGICFDCRDVRGPGINARLGRTVQLETTWLVDLFPIQGHHVLPTVKTYCRSRLPRFPIVVGRVPVPAFGVPRSRRPCRLRRPGPQPQRLGRIRHVAAAAGATATL